MEMSLDDDDYHDGGIMCNICESDDIQRRYKCLRCYNYDLCGRCFDNPNLHCEAPHERTHAMQLVLSADEKELYFKKENDAVDEFESYTCPHCRQVGLTKMGLYDHVLFEHEHNPTEVICPICAADNEPCDLMDDLESHMGQVHIPALLEARSNMTRRRPPDPQSLAGRVGYPPFGLFALSGIGRGRRLRVYQDAETAATAGQAPAHFHNMPRPEANTSFGRGANILAGDILRRLVVREQPPEEGIEAELRRVRSLMSHETTANHEDDFEQPELVYGGTGRNNQRTNDNATDVSVSISAISTNGAESSVDSASAFAATSAAQSPTVALWNDERALMPSALRPRTSEEDKERMDRERADRSLFVQDVCFWSMFDVAKPETGTGSQPSQSRSIRRTTAKKSIKSRSEAKKTMANVKLTRAIEPAMDASCAGEPGGVANNEVIGGSKTDQESVVIDRSIGDGGGDAGVNTAQQNGAANGSQV